MHPVLLTLGPVTISSFATTMSLAFLIAGFVMQHDFARKGMPPDLAWATVIAGMVGGILGAHGEYAVHHWERAVADPVGMLTNWSGMVWYGGLLGGVLATAWPIRRAKVSWASAADTAAPALAIGLAIARVGCHLAGDGDWGIPTTLPWGVAYTQAVIGWPHPAGVVVHPAPLYECAALIALFVGLRRPRARAWPAGVLFAVYLFASATIRFLIEFIRTNDRVLLGLTEAQVISLGLAAGAAWWLARPARRSALAHGLRGHVTVAA